MGAGIYNTEIEQGAKFTRTITVSDRDLTGYTARMHLRQYKESTDTYLELTTDNSRITITPGSDSVITLTVDATDTDDLSFSKAFYDLELIPASGEADVERLLEGTITLSKEVTRPTS